MEEARDEVYCHLTARRAVARAALHLGIETMSQEALDTVADVLLVYLERIGKTLSVGVEASGRSSAHCNVLDCIRAVELCTEAAVQRVHLQAPEDAKTSEIQQQTATEDTSWKGLAAFCFGPNWNQSKEQGEVERSLTSRRAGGKVGPSSTEEESSNKNGWNAPYPDELPLFPIITKSIANPHPLPASTAESLHTTSTISKEQTEQELQEIPDAVFAEGWGSLSSDRKRKQDQATPEKEPPTKKVKFTQEAAAAREDDDRAPFVPIYFPAFPKPSDTLGRLVLDHTVQEEDNQVQVAAASDTAAASSSRNRDPTVRSALVELGRYKYWGSGWETTTTSNELAALAVPKGQTGSTTSSSSSGPQVVPLGRASASRVSRILEGSMDAMTMQ